MAGEQYNNLESDPQGSTTSSVLNYFKYGRYTVTLKVAEKMDDLPWVWFLQAKETAAGASLGFLTSYLVVENILEFFELGLAGTPWIYGLRIPAAIATGLFQVHSANSERHNSVVAKLSQEEGVLREEALSKGLAELKQHSLEKDARADLKIWLAKFLDQVVKSITQEHFSGRNAEKFERLKLGLVNDSSNCEILMEAFKMFFTGNAFSTNVSLIAPARGKDFDCPAGLFSQYWQFVIKTLPTLVSLKKSPALFSDKFEALKELVSQLKTEPLNIKLAERSFCVFDAIIQQTVSAGGAAQSANEHKQLDDGADWRVAGRGELGSCLPIDPALKSGLKFG